MRTDRLHKTGGGLITLIRDNITFTTTYIPSTINTHKTKQSHTKSRQNNLHSVHARPCRIYEQSGSKNTQPCTTHDNVLGLTLDPKLTYSTQIHNISVQAHKRLQIIKALTATGWGKQNETLMATYKAIMRPAVEYASSIWSPLASSTSINKLQVMQNAALRTATGCTQDTNIQHQHDETHTLPIHEQLQLHTSQYKQKTQHPLHKRHNILQHSKATKTLFLTTAATQHTFPQTPTQSLQQP